VLDRGARGVLVVGACSLAGCSGEGEDDEPVEREVTYGPSADRIELREFYHAFDERFELAVGEVVRYVVSVTASGA
jgi:hypothetical protein